MKKNFHFAAPSQEQKAARHVRGPATQRRFAKLDNICLPRTGLVWPLEKPIQTKNPSKIHNKTATLLFFRSSNLPWDLLYLHVFFSPFSIWTNFSWFELMYFEFFMLNACIVFHLVDFTLSKLFRSTLDSDLMFKTKEKRKP